MIAEIPAVIREVEVRYKPYIRQPEASRVSTSEDLFRIFGPRLNIERVEVFIAVMLNSKNRIIAVEQISRGSVSASIVHPRDAFSTAVRLQAAAVLFLHNHPSGDPCPSRDDRECTKRLEQAGKVLGIRVLDHIVIGAESYFSFADAGQLESS